MTRDEAFSLDDVRGLLGEPDTAPSQPAAGTQAAPESTAFTPADITSLFEQDDRQKDDALKGLFDAALTRAPDKHTSILEIARRTGASTQIVETRFDEFQKAATAAEFNPTKFRTDNPKLTDLLFERPDAAPVVMRDEQISMLGKAMRGVGTFFRRWSEDSAKDLEISLAVADGKMTREQGREERNKLPRWTLKEFFPDPRPVAMVDSPLANAEGLERLMIPVAAYRRSGKAAEASSAYFKSITAKATGGDSWGHLKRAIDLESEVVPEYYGETGPLMRAAIDVSEAVSSQVQTLKGLGVGAAVGLGVGVATGLATRNPALGQRVAGVGLRVGATAGTAISSFEQETGSAYGEYRRLKLKDGSPVTDEAAIGMSVAAGLLSAGIETVSLGPLAAAYKPLGDIIRNRGGRAFIKQMMRDKTFMNLASDLGKAWLKNAAAEGGEEFFQTQVQKLFGQMALVQSDIQYTGPDQVPKFDVVGSLVEGTEAAQKGFLGGLALAAGGPLATLGIAAMNRDRAVAATGTVAAINDAAKTSGTIKGVPDLAAKLIEKETAETGEPLTAMYIAPEPFIRLFQENNADPNEAATELFGEDGPLMLMQALATGGKIEVPIAEYLEKVAGKPIADALQDHTTTRHYHDTKAEIREREAATNEEAIQIKKAFDEENAQAEAPETFVERVQKDLLETGRYSPSEARRATAPWREFVRVTLEQDFPGAKADELFDLALSVKTREQAEAATSFDFGGEMVKAEPSPPQNTEAQPAVPAAPSLLEEAQAVISRMREDNQAKAQEWLEYTQGERDERPKDVPRELILRLAEFGIVDPEGFEYGTKAPKLKSAAQQAKKGKGGGQEPAELKKARLMRNMDAVTFSKASRGYFEQAAFHGSPHKFEKFSLQKIGSGEGNQAYGWGLYFAGKKEVAEYYRKALAGIVVRGWVPGRLTPAQQLVWNDLPDVMSVAGGFVPNGQANLVSDLARAADFREKKTGFEAEAKLYRDAAEIAAALKSEDIQRDTGQLYKVEVPEDGALLDFDAKLKDQSPEVIEKLEAAGVLKDGKRIVAMFRQFERATPAERDAPEFSALLDELDKHHSDGPKLPNGERISGATKGSDIYRAIAEGLRSGPQAASEALNAAGIPGLRYLDADSRTQGGSHNYVIWDDRQVEVKETFFQDDDISPRGYVEMGRDGAQRVYDIILNKHADWSTFLHESGHVFLDVLSNLAARADAPQKVKDDWQKILGFLEVTSFADITTEHHEKWARAFESYLMEGKAPNASLVRAFQRFKLWLKSVYQNLTALNVELDDEIRGVFDRMFATDAEIARAKERAGIIPMFRSPEEANMSEEDWQKYQDTRIKSESRAARAAELRLFKDRLRETEAWWKDEENGLYEKALEEFDKRPEALATRYIRKGELLLEDGRKIAEPQMGRMDRKQVYSLIGEARAKENFGWRLLKNGGETPDAIAELFGFKTGKEMLEAVVGLPDREAWAEERAHDAMLAKYPDVLQERTDLEAIVAKGLHGDATAEWFMMELKALSAKAYKVVYNPEANRHQAVPNERLGIPLPPIESIKKAARLIAADRRLGQLNPHRAAQAERSFSNKAVVAAARGDFVQAALYKQKQILNFHLWKELTEAQEEREALEKLAAKMVKAKARGRLWLAGKELLSGVDALLASLGLFKPDPGDPPLEPDMFDAAVARLHAEIMPPAFDQKTVKAVVVRGDGLASLTVAEMRNVHTALLQLRKASIDINNVEHEGKVIALNELRNTVDLEASRLPKKGLEPISKNLKGGKERFYDFTSGFIAGRRNPRDIIARLGATAFDFLWKGYISARNSEQDLALKILTFFQDHWDKLPPAMQRRRYEVVDTSRLPVPESVGLSSRMDRQSVWMMALNMGNQSNRDRLLGGYGWNEQQVMDFLNDNLSKEEWEFIQSVWDLLSRELYPSVAAHYQSINGVPPKKIEATPIKTPHGEFRGGYFPAKYDKRATPIGAAQDESAIQNLYSNRNISASVAASFTHERVEGARDALDLNWGVVPGHLSQVIHYITHDAYVRKAARLIKSKGATTTTRHFERTVRERLGEPSYRQIDAFLKFVANGAAVTASQEMKEEHWLLNVTKSHYVASAIGYSVKSAMGNWANPLAVMGSGELSYRHGTAAYLSVFYRYKSMRAFALANSYELRVQRESYSTKLKRELDKYGATGKMGKVEKRLRAIVEFSGIVEETVNGIVNTVIWEGAFREALSKGATEAQAISQADDVVNRNAPSKNAAEQPAILRDKQTTGVLGAFFSYWSTLGNAFMRIRDRYIDDTVTNEETGRAGMRAAAQVLGLFTASMVIGEVLNGSLPEEDENIAEWLLRMALTKPFAILGPVYGPIGEIIGQTAYNKALDKDTRINLNARTYPTAALLERIAKQVAKAFDEDRTEAEKTLAGVDAAMTIIGVPGAGQLNRAANYVLKVQEGEASTSLRIPGTSIDIPGAGVPVGIIYGPPRKQK